MSTIKNTGFVFISWHSSSGISTLNISQTVTPEPIKHTIFWKDSVRSSSCIKYFAQTVTKFLLQSTENTENEPFVKS